MNIYSYRTVQTANEIDWSDKEHAHKIREK